MFANNRVEWRTRGDSELDLLRQINALSATIHRTASPISDIKLRKFRDVINEDVSSSLGSSIPVPGTRAYAVVEKMETARIHRERVRRAEHHAAAVLLRKWRQRIMRRTRKKLQRQLLYLFLMRKHAPRVLSAIRSAMGLSKRIRDARRRVYSQHCKAALAALMRHVGYKRLLWAAWHQYKPKRIGWTIFRHRLRIATDRYDHAFQYTSGAAAYHDNLRKGKGLTALRKYMVHLKEIREYLSHHNAYYQYMVLKKGFKSFKIKMELKIRARKVGGMPRHRHRGKRAMVRALEFDASERAMCKFVWRRWRRVLIIPKMQERVALGVAILKAYAVAFQRLQHRAVNSNRRRLEGEIKSNNLLVKKIRNKKGAKSVIIMLPCRIYAAFHRILDRIMERHHDVHLDRQRQQRLNRSCVCRAWRLWRARHIARRREDDRVDAFESLADIRHRIDLDHLSDGGATKENVLEFCDESESQAWHHYVTSAKKRMLDKWIQYMTVRSYYQKLYKQAGSDDAGRLRTRAHRSFIQWSVTIRTAKGKYLTATAARILGSEAALKLKALTVGSSKGASVSMGDLVSMATVKALKGSITLGKAIAAVDRRVAEGAKYFDNLCKFNALRALMKLAWKARFSQNCQSLGNKMRLARYLRNRWLEHFLRINAMKTSMLIVKRQSLRWKFRRFMSRLRYNSKSVLRRKMELPAWRDMAFQTFHALIMNVCSRKQRRAVLSNAISHGMDSTKYEALRKFVVFITRRRANQRLVERAVLASNVRICRVCFRAWANCFRVGRETIKRGMALRSQRLLRVAVGRFKRMLQRRRKLKWMQCQGKRCHSNRVLQKATQIWVSWTFRSVNNRDLLRAAQGNADFHNMCRYLRIWDNSRNVRANNKHRIADADSYSTHFRLRRTLKSLWTRVRLTRELRQIPLLQQRRRQMKVIERDRIDANDYSHGASALWQTQWQRFTSDEGYVYYYNNTTGDSMWEDEFLSTQHAEVEGHVEYTDSSKEPQPYELDGYSDCALHCVKKQKFLNRLRKKCQMKHCSHQIAWKRTQKVFDVWHQSAIYRHQAKFITAVRSRLEWRFCRSQLQKSFRRWVLNYYPRSWIKRCAMKAVMFTYKNSIKRWQRNLRFFSNSNSFTDAVFNRNRYAAIELFAYKASSKALRQFIAFVKKVFVSKRIQTVTSELYASQGLRKLASVWKRFAIRRHREKRRNRKLNRYYLKCFCRRVFSALQMLVAMQWARRQRVRLVNLYYRKQALGRALRQMSKNVRPNQPNDAYH